MSYCHNAKKAKPPSDLGVSRLCHSGSIFHAVPLGDSLAAKYGLRKSEYLAELPFRDKEYWHIDSTLDLNGDGKLELLLGDGNPGDYGPELALISPCNDSGYALIFGPILSNSLYFLLPNFVLPSKLAPLSSGIDSLGSAIPQNWPSLLTLSYRREVAEEEGFDPYSNVVLRRLEMDGSRYVEVVASECKLNIQTDAYVCFKNGTP